MVDIQSAASIDKHSFLAEAFTEFSIAIAVLIVRIFARTKAVGFRGWQGDDCFAVLCIFFWIVSLVAVYSPCFPGLSDSYEQIQVVLVKQVLNNGVNIGISDEARYELSLMPDEYARFVLGSKCYLASWFIYISLIWALKACTLFLFNRIT
jgi:hypothetical protein